MNLRLVQGDITKMEVDAIVNAANSSLLGGGGVDGAIHRAGGVAILEACREIRRQQGPLAVGEAVITTAGELPARYVIHTVGPQWQGGQAGESELLRKCYLRSLNLAAAYQLAVVAFPNISTGVYGYPKDRAAKIVIDTLQAADFKQVQQVILVCFDDENYRLYQQLLSGR